MPVHSCSAHSAADGFPGPEDGRKAYAIHNLHCRAGRLLHGMVRRELRPNDEGKSHIDLVAFQLSLLIYDILLYISRTMMGRLRLVRLNMQSTAQPLCQLLCIGGESALSRLSNRRSSMSICGYRYMVEVWCLRWWRVYQTGPGITAVGCNGCRLSRSRKRESLRKPRQSREKSDRALCGRQCIYFGLALYNSSEWRMQAVPYWAQYYMMLRQPQGAQCSAQIAAWIEMRQA